MSGDSQPAAQSVTTTNTAPWSGQQPYLETGFKRAESDILNQPQTFYPNSTVVPMNQNTTQGLNMQANRAIQGDPTVQAGAAQVAGTVGGDYLNANPYLQGAINNATQPIMQNFNESIIPGIQSGFSTAGRYGSGLQAQQQLRAGEAAGRQASEIAMNMSNAQYGDERGRQLQAASLAPQYGQEAYRDAGSLQNVGAAYEAEAGQNLQEDITRFNQGQQAPKDALSQYMALVGGGSYGGSSVGTSPIYRNKTADNLGMAATGAGIAGTLFGGDGIWPRGN